MNANSPIESALRLEETMPLTDDNKSLLQTQLCLAGHTAGLSLSTLTGFSEFNPRYPESTTQGVVESIHEMQQLSCSLTGMNAASLVALDSSQAIFASLSMIKKYHQRKKQTCNQLLLCSELTEVNTAARQANMDVKQIKIKHLEENLNENVAAIVLCLPSPDEQRLINKPLLARIRAMGILIYIEGSHQYFIPTPTLDSLDIDILSLDLGHLSETGVDCYAVLCRKNIQPYLPTPIIQQVDNRFQLQSQLQNPLSIGPLNMGAGNIESILRCYTQFRLKGLGGIVKQALKAIVAALYLTQKITGSGFEKNVSTAPLSGSCRIIMPNAASSIMDLQQNLKAYSELGLQQNELVVENDANVVVTISHLHYMTKKQLDSLIELIINHLKLVAK